MEKDFSLPQVRVSNLGQQEYDSKNEKTCSNKPYCNETSRDLEHLQSFLLQLSDRIHNYQNADQITRIAAQETGQHLAADLAGYVELKEVNGVLEGLFDPEAIWRNPHGSELEIPAVMELHGTAYRQLLEQGQAVAITDYRSDPRSGDGKLVFRLCASSQQAKEKQTPFNSPTDINGAIITSPVRYNNRIAGLLFAYSQKPRIWLPIEISLMLEVVKRAWEAIERARSAAAEAAWSNTLTRLHRLSMMVLNQSDLNRVYHEITKSTIALTEADRCNIQLYDESTGTLTLVSQNQRRGKPFKPKQYSAQGWGVSREAIEQGRRRIVKDITRSPYYVDKPELKILLAAGVRATQATPLVSSAGRTIGILATQYNQPHAYEQRELQVLDLFARLTADTIERIRSEKALREQYQLMAGINRVYRQITHQMSSYEIAVITLKTICEMTESDSGLIAIRKADGSMDDVVVLRSDEDGFNTFSFKERNNQFLERDTEMLPAFLQTVFKNAKPLLLNNAGAANLKWPSRHIPIHTFAAVPMFEYEKVVGVIAAANRPSGYQKASLSMIEGMGEAFVHLLRRWQAEKALRESEARAQQLVSELREVDASKNNFLGVLSHEIRNPLAAIKLGLTLLERVEPGSAKAEQALEIIGRQTNQLTHLVDDLLDVTRIARDKVELKCLDVNLNDLVTGCIRDFEIQFKEKGITFNTTVTEQQLQMCADPTRITQIVGNLLNNAAKFTCAGGEVRLVLQTDPAGKQAVINISDTGEGISPELLPKLFTAFTQASNTLDRSNSGLGLGLSIAKGLVELHGGEISVSSEGLGHGSSFEIRLPLKAADDGSSKTKEAAFSSDDGHHCLRILLIEDSHDLAESISTLLSIYGHDVETAYDGLTGLEKARADHPDVVLCDIGLPEMDGYEVARALRGDPSTSDIFLIAISGYAQADDIKKALEAGFDHHMVKPIEINKIRQILDEEVIKKR